MVRSITVYEGEKHCTLTHEPSQSTIETDAPKDNNGRGERFSPTDLVGAALGSCILTTMAIMAERANESENVSIRGARAEVTKEMASSPRRIKKLEAHVYLSSSLTPEWRKRLEAAAHTCPVHRSLSPEMELPITFHYE